MRCETKVVAADWKEASSQWMLTLDNFKNDSRYEEYFDVIITAIGRFNEWKLPDYPGIESYTGHLRHASNWDASFNPEGKRIAVIGNGASGLQVVPNLQKLVKHLDHYARSPQWIATSFAGEGNGRQLEPNYFPEEQLKTFEDPDEYLKFRQQLEAKFYRGFGAVFTGSKANEELRQKCRNIMAERLTQNPELLDYILPHFAPNCRRLTPGPGYLEALTQENVSYITTPISNFTKDGIVTEDEVERKVDAVICCTGANIDLLPPFPIRVPQVGTLQDAWKPDPYHYIGMATPSFPNLLFVQGPNGTGTGGTVPNQIETQVTYIAQLLRKVKQQSLRTFVPLKEAADDYMAYSDAFFSRTVWTAGCKSWANSGRPDGRIHGHWPGSASHANILRRNPRWEDWEWTYRSKTGNRFAYLGNGWTAKEMTTSEDAELVQYLQRPDSIDLRAYHEEWFSV